MDPTPAHPSYIRPRSRSRLSTFKSCTIVFRALKSSLLLLLSRALCPRNRLQHWLHWHRLQVWLSPSNRREKGSTVSQRSRCWFGGLCSRGYYGVHGATTSPHCVDPGFNRRGGQRQALGIQRVELGPGVDVCGSLLKERCFRG